MVTPGFVWQVRIGSFLFAFALLASVYIYIRKLSSFRAPTLWFIDLTVATCHIQYTFMSLCQFFFFFFSRENGTKHENTPTSAMFVWHENGRRWLLGAQSINTERATLSPGQMASISFIVVEFSVEWCWSCLTRALCLYQVFPHQPLPTRPHPWTN